MTKEIVHVGILGTWHSYSFKFSRYMFKGLEKLRHWNLQPNSFPDCRLVGVWDDVPERALKYAKEFNCEFEPDLDKFLSNPEMDAVIICSPTVQHEEHVIKAANAGKSIYIEKSPFGSLEGAYLAREAVKRNGVKFVTSSPMDKRRVRFAKEMMDSGKLGDITEVRFRLYDKWALDNPQPVSILNKQELGGGAMMDYGQHGVHILNWFFGMPIRVSAQFGYVTEFARKYNIEDNAIATFQFPNGVLGVVETGWTAPDHECILDVYGTKGRVNVGGDERRFAPDGTKTIVDDVRYCLNGGNWIHVNEDDLPAPISYPLRYWIDCIKEDLPIERQNIDEAVAWTEMLDACYRSVKTQMPIVGTPII